MDFFNVPPKEWRFSPWVVHEAKAQFKGASKLTVVPSIINVEKLVKEREEARRDKNWAKSDEIRKQLADAGVIIEDRPDGTTRVKR